MLGNEEAPPVFGGAYHRVLYDRELDVMQVLWDRGSATVAEVRAGVFSKKVNLTPG